MQQFVSDADSADANHDGRRDGRKGAAVDKADQHGTEEQDEARRVSGGEPASRWGFVFAAEACLSAPIQSVSFWSHAGLRLFNREDTVTTVKTAAVAIRIGQKTPIPGATAASGTTTATGQVLCRPHCHGSS